MDIQAKLDQLSDKLLDTGKRNNLINFRDTLTSSAEVVFPDSESVFSKCTVGHVFRVFDPKIPEDEEDVASVLLEEELTAIIEEAAANDDDLALSAEIAPGAGFVIDAESTDTDTESTGTNAEGTATTAEGTAATAENADANTEKTAENPDTYSHFPVEQGTSPEGDSAAKSAAVKSAGKKTDSAKSGSAKSESQAPKKLTKKEFTELYSPKIKNDKTLLLYAQTANPLTAVKNIAKKAKDFLDETGINVAYLAFGFVRWNEKEVPDVFFRAPLLLVHVNIITKSVIDPIKIEISDDDVVLNPTFDYLLKAEYGVSLPPFEDGETLASYYSKVSEVIRRTKWEVLDECKLGIFSFLKINMYEDLKQNAEQILKNRNVLALLSGADPNAGLPDSGLVIHDPLTELHTVVDADSSQLEAIEMAKSGKSFVLQGPPGTGKSQTITNIIAECLYDGKKVLFVSEKQAALNVVFDKLKKAGLADFCLELHSHKANKKAVLDELNRTLELPKSAVSSVAQEEIRQKKDAQERLDKYAEGLHQKRETIEKSLYQLIELYSSEREQPDLQSIIPDIQAKGDEYFHQALKLLDQYVEYVPSVGANYKTNPWYGFTGPRMSYSETNQFKMDLTQLLTGFKALRQTADQLGAQHGIASSSFSDTTWWQTMLAFLAESDVVTPAILSPKVLENGASSVQQMAVQGGRILSERNRLFREFRPEVLQKLNGQDLYTKLTTRFRKFFSRLFNRNYRDLIAKIQSCRIKKTWLGYNQVVSFAEHLKNLQTLTREFEKNEAAVRDSMGPGFRGLQTNWAHVTAALNTLRELLRGGTKKLESLAKLSQTEFAEKQEQFQQTAQKLEKELQAVSEVVERIAPLFDKQKFDLKKGDYSECVQKLQDCLENFAVLGNWIRFKELLEQMKTAELLPFIDETIDLQAKAEDVPDIYRKSFYKQWIEHILFSDPDLDAFTRIKQDQAVLNFKVKDELSYEISKSQIKSKLSRQRPNLDMVVGGSAVAILRSEGQKKRKQMPIRKLLSETGSLVQKIKPCFLMSPLSVSTFLDSEKIAFDTIVFDEASQIFPQDAIGAIYRGAQLIVVGDSKQMPPSNFFNTTVDIETEDDFDNVNDFESILDVCSAVFNTKRLIWHYRSHYEQLIAFSNANFYNNNLITFPSSTTDHEGIGVDFFHVGGIFDRRTKTNLVEAQFIVDLIYQNIEKYPNRSLGVVAFSVSQQELIDRLLSKKRERDPSYEWFFSADRPEPFFIKNLETVQGDERDTIIFSVAYARDADNRFIHNFGPLNREGGERRLNVAFTRAKDNVQLVSSIHYTDINLNSSGSEGVRLLRAYLNYAQNGEATLEKPVKEYEEDTSDVYFEQEVCDYLREQGFVVEPRIGCSEYKIDLGLKKPDEEDFLVAVECDGTTYHRFKNARDRDCLRQRVLENMGWKFYRIWSVDWYRNNPIEKEALLQMVQDAVQKSSEPEPEVPVEEPLEVEEESAPEQNQFEIDIPERTFPEYHQVDALDIVYAHGQDFQAAIREILETEAPLSEEFLLKRIVSFFEREKVTNVVLEKFNAAMRQCKKNGILRKNGFLYLEGVEKFNLRVPGDKRDIKYIAAEELAAGLYVLIKQNVTVTKDKLCQSVMKLLGYSRMGNTIASRCDEALELLEQYDIVSEEDGVLSIEQDPAQNG